MDKNWLKRNISFIFMAERRGLKQAVFSLCFFIYLASRQIYLCILFFILYLGLFLFVFDYLKGFDKKFFVVFTALTIAVSFRAGSLTYQATVFQKEAGKVLHLKLEKVAEISILENGYVLALFCTEKGDMVAVWLTGEQCRYQRMSGEFLLELPENQRNPGGFDEASYLRQYNCLVKINLNSEDTIIYQTFSKSQGKFNFVEKADLYQNFFGFLNEKLSPKTARFLLSFGFGQRQFLSKKMKRNFTNLGLNHILAVSGFHFDLFLLPVIELTHFKRRKPFWRLFISLPFICVFLWLTNFPVGLIRAAAIFILENLFLSVGRQVPKKNILLIVGLCFLLIQPLILFQIGFQLSFFAAFIIYQTQIWLNQIAWLKKSLWLQNVILSGIVQIGLLPLLLWHFKQWQAAAVFFNVILYIPLLFSFFVSYFSFFVFLFYCLYPLFFLQSFLFRFLKGLHVLLYQFLKVLEFSANSQIVNSLSKNSTSLLISLPLLILTLYYLDKLIRILSGLSGQNISFLFYQRRYLALLLAAFLFYQFWQLPKRNWEIYFLDVGQGDACLIIAPNKKSILIDAGNVNQGYRVIMPAMEDLGVEKIDFAVISHFDQDHIGGFFDLLEHRLIKSFYMPPILSPIHDQNKREQIKSPETEILELCLAQNLNYQFLKTGDAVDFAGLPIQSKVFSPRKEDLSWVDANQKSLIFVLEIEGLKILFTGDVDDRIETKLLNDRFQINENWPYHLQADVLKVSHHGSKSSSSVAFLQAVNPQYAVISVGYNFYKHPAKETLERLEKQNIKVRRTDINGAIMLKYKKHKWQIENYLD